MIGLSGGLTQVVEVSAIKTLNPTAAKWEHLTNTLFFGIFRIINKHYH